MYIQIWHLGQMKVSLIPYIEVPLHIYVDQGYILYTTQVHTNQELDTCTYSALHTSCAQGTDHNIMCAPTHSND